MVGLVVQITNSTPNLVEMRHKSRPVLCGVIHSTGIEQEADCMRQLLSHLTLGRMQIMVLAWSRGSLAELTFCTSS